MKGKSSRNAAEEAGKKRKRNSASGGGYDGKKGEKKKLYAFIHHQKHSPNSYSLYAFDIPRPDYTTATGLTHKGSETPPPPPPGVNIDPVLRFSSKEWPSLMGSVCVKSKLYIMGGSFGGLRPLATYPKSVYTLDLSSPTVKSLLQSSEFIDEPKKLMVKVADMRTGKVNPRAFKSDGKVYVLSGQDHCLHQRRLQLTQFEVYSPKRDKWTTLPSPPFKNLYLLGHVVVVGRLVIVSGNNGGGGAAAADELFFCFNLDSKVWSRFNTSGWNKLDKYKRRFCYSENTQVVGNTLYSLCFAPTPSISIVPIKHWKEETPNNNYLIVHKYKISSPRFDGGGLACAYDKIDIIIPFVNLLKRLFKRASVKTKKNGEQPSTNLLGTKEGEEEQGEEEEDKVFRPHEERKIDVPRPVRTTTFPRPRRRWR